jgi:fibronectin type 3 domain-containing protein
MRMATRRKRWIAIGGATAAVAVGVWAAAGTAATSGLVIAPAVTKAAPHLTWGEDDAANLTSYDVERSGAGCTGFTVVGHPASAAFDDPVAADGAYCYRVTGHYSDAPDSTSNTAPVLLDTTAPDVHITSPSDGSTVKGQVQIQATAPDAGSGLASIALSVDGQTITPTGQGTATWTPNADGTYAVNALATDNLGTSKTVTIHVNVDNTAPAAPHVTAAQSPVAGSPTLVWSSNLGEAYHVSRTSATGPGPKNFPDPVMPPFTDPDTLPPGTYTYTVTANDSVGNASTSAPVSVIVTPPSLTAPRSISAASPTNAVPHITWQPPVTFAVTSWQVYRDGSLLTSLSDPAASSFDDTTGATQGPHLYAVQAISGPTAGDVSSPVSVIYDTIPPSLGGVTATPNPDGSIALGWPDAVDAVPGSGLSKYIVRRGGQTSLPADPAAGTAVCTVTLPASTGCIDSATDSGTIYGYSVFAVDAAGNVARQTTSARAFDSLPPDPVTGFRATVGPTNAHLEWNAPLRQGKNADLAGYKIIKLGTGIKQPTNPRDGSEVCPGLSFRDADCFVQNLTTGVPVTFAIYAEDAVPNFSVPAVVTVTPNSSDHKKPGLARKVKIKRVGAKITMTWLSPKDRDLSKFRVTLYNNGPAVRPSKGKAIVTGRVLHCSFNLKAGQIVYVNLFAIDLSGNFSRVTRLIVMPDRLFEPKSKHKKVVKKKTAGTKTPPKKQKKT